MKRSRYFEETLPEGYVAAYTIDAADKRTGVVLNLAGFAVMAAVGVAAWFCLRPTGFFEQYSVGRNLLFIAAILVYMVCHELLHGAAYKALTRRKLTFGLTLSVAFCGVPDVYVYRKTALLALLTPFVVCIPVFLLPAILCTDVWNRFYAALLLALHAWRGISAWWAAGALAAWVLYVILWLCFIGWAGRCSSAECVPKENKNPYSAGKYGA